MLIGKICESIWKDLAKARPIDKSSDENSILRKTDISMVQS